MSVTHETCPVCRLEYVADEDATPCPRCMLQLALDESAGARANTLEDRYVILREYASGGMGRVSVAIDMVMGREIALKELKAARAGSSGADARRSRFIKEARIAGLLEHPSIIPVYDIGETLEGAPYYAMKLVRGRSLKEAIQEAGTLENRLALLPHLINLAQAIAYAHDKGVVHRDIKPSNVVIGPFGETVLIDWGIAKIVGEGAEDDTGIADTLDDMPSGHTVPTRFGMAIGTPGYMAPEQAQGRIDAIDARSDVYSLGAIVYELLTGKPPFHGDTGSEALEKNLAGVYAPVERVEPMAPRELVSICERAMAPKQEARYQTALGFADDLARFKSDALVTAYAYRPIDHVRRYIRRHKFAAAVTAVAALLLCVTGAYSYLNILKANERERAASTEAIAQRNQAEYNQYLTGIQLAALRLRDGNAAEARDVLERAPESLRDWEWGYLLSQASAAPENLPRPESHPTATSARRWRETVGALEQSIPAHQAQVNRLTFGPQDQIATCSADGTARVWAGDFREPLITIDEGGDYIQSVRFSPDGARLLVAKAYENTAQLWSCADGALLATLSGHDQPIAEARFSPDGTLVVTASTDGTARIWQASDGTPVRTVSASASPLFDAAFTDDKTLITAALDGVIAEWTLETGERTRDIVATRGDSYLAMQFDDTLNRCLGVRHDGASTVWDLQTGAQVASLRGRAGGMETAAFSPDGTAIVAPAAGGGVHVWSAEDGAPLARLAQSEGKVTAVEFSPDGAHVLVGDLRGEVTRWSPRPKTEFTEFGRLTGHNDVVFSAGFSPDASRLVTGSYDGSARVWDAATGALLAVLPYHEAEVVGAEFTNDGQRIITIAWNSGIHYWDSETYELLGTAPSLDRGGATGAFLGGPRTEFFMNLANIRAEPLGADDETFLMPDGPNTFGVWLLPSWEKAHSFDRHEAQAAGSTTSPDGQFAATGAMDGSAYIWRIRTGDVVHALEGHAASVTTLSYSPDGTRLLTTSLDQTANLWDTATGECITTISDHTAFVTGGEFSPVGNLCVTYSADSTARLWSADGAPVAPPMQHGGAVHGAKFNPAGSRLLVVTLDSVRVWDLAGNELLSIETRQPVVFANWSPDGRQIVITCRDGSVYLKASAS